MSKFNRPWGAYARLYKRGTTWIADIYDSNNRVVLCDNTGNMQIMYDYAVRAVSRVRDLERSGHVLKSWKEIMDAHENRELERYAR